jgi:hypothetical protein
VREIMLLAKREAMSCVEGDLDILAASLRFLDKRAGGIDQVPFDPFAAIERLRGRVLPELPEGWQIRAMDGEVRSFQSRRTFSANC